MSPTAVVVLAAGEGKRMKSSLVKVLHPICGKPLLYYPVALARSLSPERVVVVVGQQRERVTEYLDAEFGAGALRYAVQEEPRGTGHAVACAREALSGFSGRVLVLYGDTPLLSRGRVEEFLAAHERMGVALLAMTAVFDEPAGYGRIVRGPGGRFLRIVERRDCTPEELAIREVNLGIYAVDAGLLFAGLTRLDDRNDQGEFYLTDLVEVLVAQGHRAATWTLEDPSEVAGVNDRWELAAVEKVMRRRIVRAHAEAGVSFQDPDAAYVDADVTIGPETRIFAGVGLYGRTRVGQGCTIGAGSQIRDAILADGTVVPPFSVIEETRG